MAEPLSEQDVISAVDPAKLAAIRQKYAEEANKRLRPEGTNQFQPLSQALESRLRSLSEDPWADHEALNARPSPIDDNTIYKFFVLGAGFGGLLFAIHAIEAGVATADDVRLVDAAGGFGGTWYWNRYPGLHCDLESYMYLPLLEETGYVPKHKYSAGAEIREHAERIAKRWNLTDKALFRTDVKSAEWDDETELWTVKFSEGRGPGQPRRERQVRSRFVYLAAGVLTKPQVPKIPDLVSFKGPIFHTARWSYDVTGGSQAKQELTGLKDKRVAIVGTAATAIGAIPEVAKYAKELYVVQRTPAYVKPRNQRITQPDTWKSDVAFEKGWQYKRSINWNSFLTNSNAPGQKNLVGDGWTDQPAYSAIMGSPRHGIADSSPEAIERRATFLHSLDLPAMEAVRARIDAEVKDPETAAKLKPWYPTWCKRPTFSDTYLSSFNQPNVHLIDTDGRGPSRATPRGLIVPSKTNGKVEEKEIEVDVLIFSTGFHIVGRNGNLSPASRTGVRVTGRNGRSLDDKWAQNGAATLHGYATNGFPNLFFSGTAQATITGNNIFMLNFIAKHVVHWIAASEALVGAQKNVVIEVTREGEEAHTEEVVKRAPFFAAAAGCTPGYFNGHGEAAFITDPEEKRKRARGATWSEGALSFLKYIGDWRDEGSLKGLSVVPAKSEGAAGSEKVLARL